MCETLTVHPTFSYLCVSLTLTLNSMSVLGNRVMIVRVQHNRVLHNNKGLLNSVPFSVKNKYLFRCQKTYFSERQTFKCHFPRTY